MSDTKAKAKEATPMNTIEILYHGDIDDAPNGLEVLVFGEDRYYKRVGTGGIVHTHSVVLNGVTYHGRDSMFYQLVRALCLEAKAKEPTTLKEQPQEQHPLYAGYVILGGEKRELRRLDIIPSAECRECPFCQCLRSPKVKGTNACTCGAEKILMPFWVKEMFWLAPKGFGADELAPKEDQLYTIDTIIHPQFIACVDGWEIYKGFDCPCDLGACDEGVGNGDIPCPYTQVILKDGRTFYFRLAPAPVAEPEPELDEFEKWAEDAPWEMTNEQFREGVRFVMARYRWMKKAKEENNG